MSEDYEMMCGIEIHQQLDTKKLFCSCDSHLCDDGQGAYFRRLRPTTSEMGEVDRAALAQFQRHAGYRYQCCQGTTCLVELDEEPPHDVNPDAMDIALTFSDMLGANIIDEIHFMRKIVVDGSNTSGFQRTALIATDGSVDVGDRKISILSVCLEEDAARKVETTKNDEVLYRLDRLGIPLIEVATGPDMRTPEEVMEVAYRLGTLLRATRRVKRGIGTIRQDLNISIPGGARIELKGVGELKMIPDYVRNEVNRQRMLIRIKGILNDRGVKPAEFEPVDVTDIFADCESKVIKGALDDKGRVIAVRLPGFAGVMNGDNKTLRLGSEMAQRARTRGVKGIFHSDELPNYGIEQSYVDRLREFLGMTGETDAFVICAGRRRPRTPSRPPSPGQTRPSWVCRRRPGTLCPMAPPSTPGPCPEPPGCIPRPTCPRRRSPPRGCRTSGTTCPSSPSRSRPGWSTTTALTLSRPSRSSGRATTSCSRRSRPTGPWPLLPPPCS